MIKANFASISNDAQLARACVQLASIDRIEFHVFIYVTLLTRLTVMYAACYKIYVILILDIRLPVLVTGKNFSQNL